MEKLIREVVVSPLTENLFQETVSFVVAKVCSPTLKVRKSSLADLHDWEKGN